MQLNAPTLGSFANFCCTSSSSEFAVLFGRLFRVCGTASLTTTSNLHVIGKFLFPHQKCYGPHSIFRFESSMSFNFCGSISIFGHVCVELQSLELWVVGQNKSVFLKYLNLKSKLEFPSILTGRRLTNFKIFEL